MAVRRSSSLSEIPESPSNPTFDARRPLIQLSCHGDIKAKTSKKSRLQRCKSTPENKLTKQNEETNPDAWKCAWDKERGYVTDLITEQQPTKNRPQLSYFAYLGNNYPGKARYQAVSGDTEVIINLGNGIIAKNRSSSMTNSEEVFHGSDVHINSPIKPDATRILECCSCMCCVKAIFYHCTKDGDFERNWADEPCSCDMPGTNCGARWGILGMFSLFLPCLVCYPLIKVCCNSPFN